MCLSSKKKTLNDISADILIQRKILTKIMQKSSNLHEICLYSFEEFISLPGRFLCQITFFGQASLCLRVYDTTIYAGFSMMLHDKMDILDRLTRYCGLLVKMIKRRPKFYPQLVDAQDLRTWFEIQFLLNHIDHYIMMMQFYFQSNTKGSSDIEFERHVFLLSTFSFFTISLSNHHFREFCQLVKVWKFFFSEG